jgi:hypothetical protein
MSELHLLMPEKGNDMLCSYIVCFYFFIFHPYRFPKTDMVLILHFTFKDGLLFILRTSVGWCVKYNCLNYAAGLKYTDSGMQFVQRQLLENIKAEIKLQLTIVK